MYLQAASDVSEYDVAFGPFVVAKPSAKVRLSKRALDVTAVLVGLPAVLLILAIAVLAIKITSRGPVLFVQHRYGLNRVPFRVYKLRTMTVAENGSDFRQVVHGDPRITRVGAFLRKTSIDELPQIFNVLLGDMSLVGPRPHATAMDDEYALKIPNYDRRFEVLPGITGLAQVRGHRGVTDTLEKMQTRIDSDLEYVGRQRFLLDVGIIFRTLLVVLGQRNAF